MVGMLIAVALFAAPPIPSKVLTVKVGYPASIVVGATAPSDSQFFSDVQEVLASINTANYNYYLCQLGMNTILTRHK